MSISARAVNVSIKFFGIVAVVSSLSSCQNSDYFESFRRDDERFQLAEQPVYAYSTKPQESATPAMSNPNFKMMPSRNFDLPKSDVISSDLNTLHPQLSRSDLNKPPVASKNHSGVKSELPKRARAHIYQWHCHSQ